MKFFRDFCKSLSGNVAMTFAIAIVPMVLAIGSGVDMMRANQAQTLLQAAADAAALGGGASPDATDSQLQNIAATYLDSTGAGRGFGGLTVRKIKNNTDASVFSVEVESSMATSFVALAGVPTLNVKAISEVRRSTDGPLEMVLALDTTYSMAENGKMGVLRAAANDLVNSVMTGGDVKVGVAPFADYFKVGTKYKNESWVNVPAPMATNYESCASVVYPDRSGCTVEATCYADGVPYSCNQESCADWGEPVKSSCAMVSDADNWDGCVGARPPAYQDSIGNAAIRYPGVLWDCGTALTALTTDRTEVLSSIAGLYPSGNTNIPSGLIWAWNLLTPEAPLTEAATMSAITAKGGKKVMVLMTDGANTVSPYADGSFGAHGDTAYGNGTYTDKLTASLCTKIKNQGIIVYTVSFDVTDASIQTLLRDCASDPAKSYVADDAVELVSAFNDIGVSLTELRLTR